MKITNRVEKKTLAFFPSTDREYTFVFGKYYRLESFAWPGNFLQYNRQLSGGKWAASALLLYRSPFQTVLCLICGRRDDGEKKRISKYTHTHTHAHIRLYYKPYVGKYTWIEKMYEKQKKMNNRRNDRLGDLRYEWGKK